MKHIVLATISIVALAAAGACIGFERSSSLNAPSGVGINGLLGVWTSDSIVPSPNTCSDFKWEVTENTATTAAGNFSATCAGGLKLAGRANGTLAGTDIAWTATGTATAADLPPCAISLNGTAKLETDHIRVPYSGTTCLGPVSGTEILRRK
jgi:hypothetical protein